MSNVFIGIIFLTALAGLLLGGYLGLVTAEIHDGRPERKRRRKVRKIEKKKEKNLKKENKLRIKENKKEIKQKKKQAKRLPDKSSTEPGNLISSTEEKSNPAQVQDIPEGYEVCKENSDSNTQTLSANEETTDIEKNKKTETDSSSIPKNTKEKRRRQKTAVSEKKQKKVSLKDRVSDNDSYLSFVCGTEGTNETETIKENQKKQDDKFLI